MNQAVRDKRNKYSREWFNNNPEKTQEYRRRAEKKRKNDPGRKAWFQEYSNRPGFKAKKREYNKVLYKKDPVRYAPEHQRTEIRTVLRYFVAEDIIQRLSLEDSYDMMVSVVQENREVAATKCAGGLPDAKNLKVEYKIGLDRIRANQLIWNVLNGHDCKIRWVLSYDDIERTLCGGVDNSVLFDSYRDFIMWRYEGMRKDEQCSVAASQ
jgi:hypothetical protein